MYHSVSYEFIARIKTFIFTFRTSHIVAAGANASLAKGPQTDLARGPARYATGPKGIAKGNTTLV